MKGRKGMELRGTKIALAAVLTCLLSLTAWLGVSQLTARAAGDGVSASANAVYYYPEDDTIMATNASGEAYKFFTTANASKKAPGANQWLTVDKDGYVQLAGKTGASMYYFADTPNPTVDQIVGVAVPAKPTISKVTYKAAGASVDKAFPGIKVKLTELKSSGWKVGAVTKTLDTNDYSKIEYRMDGSDAEWRSLDSIITLGDLAKLRKYGGVIDLRVKGKSNSPLPAASVTVSGSKNKALYNLAIDAQNVELIRSGVVKQVKISKLSAGPAVTIDYANHSVKLKKTASAWKVTGATDETVSGNATFTGLQDGAIYDETAGIDDYYVVQTVGSETKASSAYTHLNMEKDYPLSTYATVTLSGNYGENATIDINSSGDASKKEYYQYAITKESNSYLTTTGFDYKKATAKGTKLSWKKITIPANASQKLTTIKWSAIKDATFVYIRREAVSKDNVYSSQVVEYKVPKTDEKAWKRVVEANAGTPKSVAEAIPYVTAEYAGDNKFKLTPSEGAQIVGTKVTYGTTDLPVTASGDASGNAYVTVTDLKANKTKIAVSLTVPAGFVKNNTTNATNGAYVITANANTVKPTVKKITSSNNSVVFEMSTTLDGNTTVSEVKATESIKDASSDAIQNKQNLVVDSTKVNISGKKITITCTNSTSAGEVSEITLTEIKFAKNTVTFTGQKKETTK